MTQLPTRAQYEDAFHTERSRDYPEVSAFEAACGFAVNRTDMEAAARVLACPVKANPPNWQHGRVVYAAARRYLAGKSGPVVWFDCGTAKGFSALMGLWALRDAGVEGRVESVDVIDPKSRVFRNSVLDADGDKHELADYLASWPEASAIRFYGLSGIGWLLQSKYRVDIAFIDGKHSSEAVSAEGSLLAARQHAGDVAIFDDAQMPPVAQALKGLRAFYEFQTLALAGADRAYAIGVRR